MFSLSSLRCIHEPNGWSKRLQRLLPSSYYSPSTKECCPHILVNLLQENQSRLSSKTIDLGAAFAGGSSWDNWGGSKGSRDARWLGICYHILTGKEGSNRNHFAVFQNLLTLESIGKTFFNMLSISMPRYFVICFSSRSHISQLMMTPRILQNWHSSQCWSSWGGGVITNQLRKKYLPGETKMKLKWRLRWIIDMLLTGFITSLETDITLCRTNCR